jgi:hypothetical protein
MRFIRVDSIVTFDFILKQHSKFELCAGKRCCTIFWLKLQSLRFSLFLPQVETKNKILLICNFLLILRLWKAFSSPRGGCYFDGVALL